MGYSFHIVGIAVIKCDQNTFSRGSLSSVSIRYTLQESSYNSRDHEATSYAAGILPSAHAGCFPQKCCGTSESAVLPFLSFEPRRTYPAPFDLALYRFLSWCASAFGMLCSALASYEQAQRKHGSQKAHAHDYAFHRFPAFCLLFTFYIGYAS